jgi:hypothetical protein
LLAGHGVAATVGESFGAPPAEPPPFPGLGTVVGRRAEA